MNQKQFERMKNADGFIAALDQSGGSTPKALRLYGVNEDRYSNDEEMFNLVHEMRKRIIKSPAFNSQKILAAILFKITMNSKIDGKYTSDYLWDKKGIVPILKVDEGLAELKDGVQLMKEMKSLDELLINATERNIFGTKMRSLIKEYNESGIKAVVEQQFDYAKKIIAKGFVPIIEPEVDINSSDKEKIEEFLHKELKKHMEKLDKNSFVIFKLTIPSRENTYLDLYDFENTLRIVALSGGYSREMANDLLRKNKKMVASFSRALSEGLKESLSDEEFNSLIENSIDAIYDASVNK